MKRMKHRPEMISSCVTVQMFCCGNTGSLTTTPQLTPTTYHIKPLAISTTCHMNILCYPPFNTVASLIPTTLIIKLNGAKFSSNDEAFCVEMELQIGENIALFN